VAKQGLIKGQHAIIYTGQEPGPNENENPNEHEVGMLQSIRVKNFKPSERLDKLSRINFAKIYTVCQSCLVYRYREANSFLRSNTTSRYTNSEMFTQAGCRSSESISEQSGHLGTRLEGSNAP